MPLLSSGLTPAELLEVPSSGYQRGRCGGSGENLLGGLSSVQPGVKTLVLHRGSLGAGQGENGQWE